MNFLLHSVIKEMNFKESERVDSTSTHVTKF